MIVRTFIFLIVMLVTPSVAFASNGTSATPMRIDFLGDPQIGYRGTWQDYQRFKLVIRSVNVSSPELVVIAGDLVQNRSPIETWLFNNALEGLNAKVLLAPGNHDVIDLESLDDYRVRYGPDYYLDEQGTVAVLVVNSETARSPIISEKEHIAQWHFIEQSFSKTTANNQQLIVVMHRPPFVSNEDEPDSDECWPLATRKRFISLCREHGTKLILAGHLHRTLSIKTEDGLEIRVLPGSARSFDDSPIGYEELRLSENTHESHFRFVAPPPKRPFSVPGFREWTPRLFDFSFEHWFLTLLYISVAHLCRRAAGRAPNRRSLWLPISWALLFFAANQQLDFDEFFREAGRIAAKLSGVSAIRHIITASGLLALVACGLWSLYRSRKKGTPTKELIAVSALGVPTTWFILSTISHHDIRMLIDPFAWDVLSLLALLVLALLANDARRSPS